MLVLLMQHLAEATPTQVVSIWGKEYPRYRLRFSLGACREVKPGFSKPGYGRILVTDQNVTFTCTNKQLGYLINLIITI